LSGLRRGSLGDARVDPCTDLVFRPRHAALPETDRLWGLADGDHRVPCAPPEPYAVEHVMQSQQAGGGGGHGVGSSLGNSMASAIRACVTVAGLDGRPAIKRSIVALCRPNL
jgi:hypothetical protein